MISTALLNLASDMAIVAEMVMGDERQGSGIQVQARINQLSLRVKTDAYVMAADRVFQFGRPDQLEGRVTLL